MKNKVTTIAFLLTATTLIFPVKSSYAFTAGSTDGVVSVLLKKYTLTEATMDKSQITHDGTQLSMKQAGVYSFPSKTFMSVDNKVVDGKVQKQNFFISASCSKSHCHVLQSGEKIYVTKIESKSEGSGDVLKFTVISADNIDGGDGAERYGATVTFKFKKGYLTESSPEDVEAAVEAVMAPGDDSDSSKTDDTASQPAAQQPAAPAPVQRAAAPPPPPVAPAGPPPALSVGETSSQVLEAYGMPKKIIDLGKKKTYIYKDIKIVFTDDKITDMQPL
jgi:hypothetical protein